MATAPAASNTLPKRPCRVQPLVVLLGALCGGILIDRFAGLPLAVWFFMAGIGFALWAILWWNDAVQAAAVALCLVAAAVSGVWHHCWWNHYPADHLARGFDESRRPACLEVTVLNLPRIYPAPPRDPMRTIPLGDRTQLDVRTTRIRNGATWQAASGVMRMTVDGHLLGITAGDRLEVFGHVARPETPKNPNEFDFASHARSNRRLTGIFVSHPDCVRLVERGSPYHWRRMLAAVRNRCRGVLWQHLEHRPAGLAQAVLLGAREELGSDRTEEFFTTGTIHLLAISGLHVGILACGVWWLTRVFNFGRRTALVFAAVTIVLYATLVEARPPVLRATALIVVFCVAQLVGRRSFGFNTLAAAGILILAMNPAAILNVGTQLSFLAVAIMAGAVLPPTYAPAEDPLTRLIENTRPWPVRMWRKWLRQLWRLWLLSALIWGFTLPLTAYRFHLVSPIALVLNPLLIFPITVALFSGFAVLLLGWLSPLLADICGTVCNVSFQFIESAVHFAHETPGTYFWTSGPKFWWVAGFYFVLTLLVVSRLPRRWNATLIVTMIAIGLLSARSTQRALEKTADRPLRCTFVAVGHGCAVLIELPSKQTLLYDAGRLGSPRPALQSISAVLWSRGIEHIDAIVLSHADADHYNVLPELLKRVSVGVVYVSPFMFETPNESLLALRESIAAAGVPMRTLRANMRLSIAGSTSIDVLHPTGHAAAGGDNANSIVLRLEHQGSRILLTGDLEGQGMDRVLRGEPSCHDVVLAPHHGSARSSPVRFAAWSRPKYLVISGGEQVINDSVRDPFEKIGATVLNTATDGAVFVTVDGKRLTLKTWADQRPP